MARQPRIVIFSGSTRRPSRSRGLGLAIAERVEEGIDVRIDAYDVVDAGPGLAAGFARSELGREALRVVEAIEQADAVIAITPVYKGSYSGLFKHLIDFVDPNALSNKPVVIGATGGGHRHALIVEHQLRPLFGFFSALIVPTSVYVSDHEFVDGTITDAGVVARVDTAADQLTQILAGRHQLPLKTAQSAPDPKVIPVLREVRARAAAI